MNRDVMPPDGYEEDGLFQTVMFGYDRAQVDEYIDAICDELHVLSSAVKRLTPIENDLLAANAEVDRLREALSAGTPSAAASVRIQEMLKLAEQEGATIRDEAQRALDQAHRDAEQIRRAAEVDCEHVAADRRREYQRLREDVLAGAQAEAARIMAEVNGRSGGLALATNVRNGLAKPATAVEARSGPAKGGVAKNPSRKRANPAEDFTAEPAED
jgi:DivIVA domain-containing protein